VIQQASSISKRYAGSNDLQILHSMADRSWRSAIFFVSLFRANSRLHPFAVLKPANAPLANAPIECASHAIVDPISSSLPSIPRLLAFLPFPAPHHFGLTPPFTAHIFV
jgi:hypothetical protein